MARYSRRTGPTVAFELTGAIAQIPGFQITRTWDEGELLILWAANVINATAGVVNANIFPVSEGLTVPVAPAVSAIPAGQRVHMSGHALLRVTGGTFGIGLFALGSAAAGDTIEADSAILTVIQLPVWDSDADIL